MHRFSATAIYFLQNINKTPCIKLIYFTKIPLIYCTNTSYIETYFLGFSIIDEENILSGLQPKSVSTYYIFANYVNIHNRKYQLMQIAKLLTIFVVRNIEK